MAHEIRNIIIRDLIHKPGMGFNELWKKEGDSNKFAYHLKVMEEDGLIEKKDNKYFLAHEGKKQAVFIDGETGKKPENPLAALLLVVFDSDKILLHERLKEPFYGYFGFAGAKMEFGEKILECAARELKEETNLEADMEIAGLINFTTYNNDKLAYHHVQFVVKCTNPKGTLKKEDREGKYYWVDKEDFMSKKLFPDDPYIFEWLDTGNFFIAEMERFQENDEFKDVKTKNIYWYGPNNNSKNL